MSAVVPAARAPEAKRAHERWTFEAFCAAANLPLVPGSIEQPEPPAPDLVAEFAGAGRIAFELVRLNDPDQLIRLRLMHRMPGFLDRQFAALPADGCTRDYLGMSACACREGAALVSSATQRKV
jgi:hypothetical protein